MRRVGPATSPRTARWCSRTWGSLRGREGTFRRPRRGLARARKQGEIGDEDEEEEEEGRMGSGEGRDKWEGELCR